MLEGIAGPQELGWDDPGTGQEQLTSHFAEDQLHREGGHRDHRGPAQNRSERLGELPVGHRVGGNQIDRSLQRFGDQRVVDGAGPGFREEAFSRRRLQFLRR